MDSTIKKGLLVICFVFGIAFGLLISSAVNFGDILREPVAVPVILWEADIQDSVTAPLQYIDDNLYVAVNTTVIAFNVKTGEKVWERHVHPIISPPEYSNGNLYIVVEEGIIALDASTGASIWEYTVKDRYSSRKDYLEVSGGAVYIGTPTPSVCSLDAESGDVIWEYTGDIRTTPRVRMSGDNLLVYSTGLLCLERKTGTEVWALDRFFPSIVYYSDVILAYEIGEPPFHYVLIDKGTGRTLWKEEKSSIDEPDYQNGILCYSREGGNTLTAVDARTGDRVWEFDFEKTLHYRKVHEKGIFLVIRDDSEKSLYQLVHLGWDGTKIWEHDYEEGIAFTSRDDVWIGVFDNTVIFFREGAFIEVFDMDKGEKMWDIKVKEPVDDIQLYKNLMYLLSAGVLYCLDMESGNIMWDFCSTNINNDWSESLEILEIVDDMIFLFAHGKLCVLSLEA